MINKDTLIFGSFSENPGNNGTLFFNNKFAENHVNAIYKSFYATDIKQSFLAAKTIGFGGFAVSMPFKFEVVKLIDEIDEQVKNIGAANTILFKKDKSYAFNTDYLAAKTYLENLDINDLIILGNGGFSKAIQYACKILKINFKLITRENWEILEDHSEKYIFNATPVDVQREKLIDGRPHTETGKKLAILQAEEQYQIYSELFSKN